MNKPNNKRRKESRKRIENAFVKLLQERELGKITVTDICKLAEVNRTTFYANYIDIYDLADSIHKRLEEETLELFQGEEEQHYNGDFLKLFRHIKENQLFYKTYFKLGLDAKFQITEDDIKEAAAYFNNEYIEYHVEFFRNGLNAIIKKWLQRDCKENPEEMFDIVSSEYMSRREKS